MSQQINLYSPLFRQRRKLFTAKAMLQAMVLVLAGVAAFYGYARLGMTALQRQAAEVDAQVKTGLQRVKALPAAATPAEDKMLDARIEELQTQLQARAQLTGQLGTRQPAGDYLAPLRSLARHRLEGVWLTAVNLAGDSGELSLVGRALRAELVPQYIDRLAQDPALRGRRFSTLAVERDAAKAGSVGFRLLASPEGS